MSTRARARQHVGVLVGVGCSAAAVLTLEVVLTRVFAVTQFYHFAFLTVSLALLGFGASGSALTAFPRLGRGGPRRWATLSLGQAIATVGAYLVINTVPFDSFSLAWDRRQVLYLAVYYLALAVPFFFGGAVIGAALSRRDLAVSIPSRRVYAASLAGSALGALLALAGLPILGGEGAVVLAGALAALGAVAFTIGEPVPTSGRLGTAGSLLALLVALAAIAPPVLDIELSPYKGLPAALRYPGAEVVSTRWEPGTRVDHIRSDGLRSLPGLSFTYPGASPPQDALAFDGDDLSPVPRVAPADADFAPYLLSSLPFGLRSGRPALVLDARGGLDVLVALASGAAAVTAVEPSGAAVAAARTVAGNAYGDSRVEVVVAEPRSFVERTGDRFGVVDVALAAPYRPVSSGAYSLAEDYALTVEAFDRYLDLLEPDGIVAAVRWLQTPPSEETRLVALAAAALRQRGIDPATAIVALRGYANVLVMVAPDGFASADLAAIHRFAEERRFDLVAAPALDRADTNRFNVLPVDAYHELAVRLLAADPKPVYEAAEFAIAPPRDDRPFFGHFFKWSQAGDVWEGLGRSWQPFGGAGYFVLVALLALSALSALLLIVVPLLAARRTVDAPAAETWWTLGYFGLLGLGFLLVEIPIIQRYILLIGRPTTAVAVVLFALLLASGIGSLASARLPWRATGVALVVLIVVFPYLLRGLTGLVLPAPPAVRMAVGALAIAPLGFLMGVMFPRGLARLERTAPRLVPWAWGVNGTMSVISAAAAALAALSFGFTVVIVLGGACYAGAAVLAGPGRVTPTSG